MVNYSRINIFISSFIVVIQTSILFPQTIEVEDTFLKKKIEDKISINYSSFKMLQEKNSNFEYVNSNYRYSIYHPFNLFSSEIKAGYHFEAGFYYSLNSEDEINLLINFIPYYSVGPDLMLFKYFHLSSQFVTAVYFSADGFNALPYIGLSLGIIFPISKRIELKTQINRNSVASRGHSTEFLVISIGLSLIL